MFHVLHRFWRWLLARLGYCGGAHFLAGAPSLPPPLTPEQEKVLLSRMAAGDAAARDDLITTTCGWWCTLPKSTKAAVCLPRT